MLRKYRLPRVPTLLAAAGSSFSETTDFARGNYRLRGKAPTSVASACKNESTYYGNNNKKKGQLACSLTSSCVLCVFLISSRTVGPMRVTRPTAPPTPTSARQSRHLAGHAPRRLAHAPGARVAAPPAQARLDSSVRRVRFVSTQDRRRVNVQEKNTVAT